MSIKKLAPVLILPLLLSGCGAANPVSRKIDASSLSSNDAYFVGMLNQQLFPTFEQYASEFSQINWNSAKGDLQQGLPDSLDSSLVGTMEMQVSVYIDNNSSTALSPYLGTSTPSLTNPELKSLAKDLSSNLRDMDTNCQKLYSALTLKGNSGSIDTLSKDINTDLLNIQNLGSDLAQATGN